LAAVLLVVLLNGCGGATSSKAMPPNGTAGGSGAGGAAAQPGVGPIDAAAQPTELAMVCQGHEALSFKLPCLVGFNFGGQIDQPGFHETECQLIGKPDQTAVNFTLPLVQLPDLLNQPVQIPFRTVPVPPGGGVKIGAERFHGSLSGVAIFTEVDLQGRGFVARLEQGHVGWTGDRGTSFECNTIDGPFWGAAGSFL
jgi:hypothetical protein